MSMYKKSIALSGNTVSFARISIVSKQIDTGVKNHKQWVHRLMINDCSECFYMSEETSRKMLQRVTSLSTAISDTVKEIDLLHAKAKENKYFSKTKGFRFERSSLTSKSLMLYVTNESHDSGVPIDIRVGFVEKYKSLKTAKIKPKILMALHTFDIVEGSFTVHVRHMKSKLKILSKALDDYARYLEILELKI